MVHLSSLNHSNLQNDLNFSIECLFCVQYHIMAFDNIEMDVYFRGMKCQRSDLFLRHQRFSLLMTRALL